MLSSWMPTARLLHYTEGFSVTNKPLDRDAALYIDIPSVDKPPCPLTLCVLHAGPDNPCEQYDRRL